MSSQTHTTTQTKEAAQKRPPPTPTKRGPVAVTQSVDLAVLQRALADPGHVGPRGILALQRTAGNHAVTCLIQAKLTVGAAGDQYEREADRVAEQVMNMTVPSSAATGEASGRPQPVQRQAEEEEEVQTKPLAASITSLVQRQTEEEEEVQTKSLVQRQAEDEEEIQTKSLVQRQAEEEEEVQTKPLIQRRGEEGFEAGSDLEQRLATSRGSGSPLPAETRQFMETRFGADFSGVCVHTGGEAVQMNRQVSAQAFTLGQDIYMGEGKSNLESSEGQKLIAHELTHVIQQGGAGVTSGTAQRGTQGAGAGAIQRWDEREHTSFGNRAANLVKSWDLPKVYTRLGKGKLASFGDLTELGGDYTYTPEELSGHEDLETEGWGSEADANYAKGIIVAATNVNHFFPMASREWSVHHGKALGLAQNARTALDHGNRQGHDDLIDKAIVTEGFADHFLQDSYASGHQYPRALDAISAKLGSTTKAGYGAELGRLGLSRAKTYHDRLCALQRGLPLREGRFHGDHTMTGGDNQVMVETARSLAQVVCALFGADLGLPAPHPSDGPDVAAILADTAIDPGPGESPSAIWQEMTGALQGDFAKAEGNRGLGLETSAGTDYTAGNIADAMHRR